ncbi:MAG: alpha/beta hydrolase family protein [Promethearchaeota archaeon]
MKKQKQRIRYNLTSKRFLRVYEQIQARLRDAPRKLSFKEGHDFARWKHDFIKKVKELLGPFPESIPLELEILEEEYVDIYVEDGLPPFIRQKIIYDTEKYASCVAYLLTPADLKKGEKRAAILNAHGHGSGKKKLATDLDPASWIKDSNVPGHEASALHLVKEGFVVLVPDWRPFGERALDRKFTRPNRDPCNVTFMSFKYFGYNLLTLNIWDAMRSLDVLQSLPSVDKQKIGMVGKSYGGTLTMYTTVLDDRVKAAVISGYLSTLDDAMSMRGLGNYCGSQFLPGLLEWGDIPDVAGLIAPKPLLIESGTKDQCFVFNDTTTAYEKLKMIYHASGSPENLDRDVADVAHEYIFRKLVSFFKKNLT